jgi:hypothetical protein
MSRNASLKLTRDDIVVGKQPQPQWFDLERFVERRWRTISRPWTMGPWTAFMTHRPLSWIVPISR